MTNKRIIIALLAASTGHAQNSAYHFAIPIPPGTAIGNRNFAMNTHFSSGAALNDGGEVAFSASFPDKASRAGAVSGVYTSKRIVAESGDVIEGSTLVDILDIEGGIQINNAGAVAYVAAYIPKGYPAIARHTGVFVERHFAGNTIPYVLTEDGKAVSPQAAAAQTTGGTGPGTEAPHRWRSAAQGLAPLIHFPVLIDGAGRPAASPAPSTPPPARPNAIPAPCPVSTTFPLPWDRGAPAGGPIVSKGADGPLAGQTYTSVARGTWNAPERTVYFAAGCRPILAALGDRPHGGPALELWTPLGLVTTLGVAKEYSCDKITPPHDSCFDSVPYSRYRFEGLPEVMRIGFDPDRIRINRQCQVLIPANLVPTSGSGGWHAFIIGTPNDPAQCVQ